MSRLKVKLLRPLNNAEVGSEAEYDKADAQRLAGYGAVEIIGPADEPAEEKAEAAAPANKAEGASSSNKAKAAAPGRKGKAAKAATGQKPKGK